MLLHWIYQNSDESDDHNSPDYLYRFFIALGFDNLVDTVGLFSSNDCGKTIHSTFCKHYRTL